MSDQLNVDPDVLKQAAEGITGVISELSDLGIKDAAAQGRGFSGIELSQQDAGKLSVQQSFTRLTDRWSWGIRTLVQTGNKLAEAAKLAAGRLHMMDETFSNSFKELYADAFGNPHLTSQQIDAQSWSTTLADNQFNQVQQPDYSAASFENAWQQMKTDEQKMDAASRTNLVAGMVPGGWNTGAAAQAAQIQAAANAAKK